MMAARILNATKGTMKTIASVAASAISGSWMWGATSGRTRSKATNATAMAPGQLAHLEAGRLLAAAAWRYRVLEAQLRGLLQPGLELAHGPDLAGEADLAQEDGGGGCGQLQLRGDDGGRDREIGRRLLHPQAAGDVQIDVAGGGHKPATGLEHGQQHREPVRVPAHDGAARRP